MKHSDLDLPFSLGCVTARELSVFSRTVGVQYQFIYEQLMKKKVSVRP